MQVNVLGDRWKRSMLEEGQVGTAVGGGRGKSAARVWIAGSRPIPAVEPDNPLIRKNARFMRSASMPTLQLPKENAQWIRTWQHVALLCKTKWCRISIFLLRRPKI